MNAFRKLYRFLGSIRFAIILIAGAALFAITGTLLESVTMSHRYAALLTYEHPLFITLLALFFINILASALHRWPFKVKHISFLITHLGLLMILLGTMIKSYAGVQGSMVIREGTAVHKIRLADTFALDITKRGTKNSHQLELTHQPIAYHNLRVELMNTHPHSQERLETWIKGDQGHIIGLSPFPVYREFKVSATMDPWEIYALHTSDVSENAKRCYLQETQIRLTDRLTGELLHQGLLSHFIQQPLVLGNLVIQTALHFEVPELQLQFSQTQMTIPLSGPESLFNQMPSNPFLGDSPIAVDLMRPRTLLFLENENHDVHLLAFDPHGRIHHQIYQPEKLSPILVYDDGFEGYTVQAKIPSESLSRQELEKVQQDYLAENLKTGVQVSALAPPLAYLEKACHDQKEDFVQQCIHFLAHWNQSRSWLYPQDRPLPESLEKIFAQLAIKEQNACLWVSQVFQNIEPLLLEGRPIKEILAQIQWPLKFETPQETEHSLIQLTQQIFAVAELLPPFDASPTSLTPSEKAHLLSALLRSYGIHWSAVTAQENPHESQQFLTLETPITAKRTPEEASKKIEENLPMVTLKATQNHQSELISLTYDPHTTNFKWPILNGEYLVRFQPKFQNIPYKIRLRNARQINYPNSTQPYSYECDVIITDLRTKKSEEKTLSMNHVHETWDGYRFYLANIAPPEETAVRQVHIVVNRDPAKYFLTYPGAALLSLGILLLFWMQPYKKKE